MIEHTQNVHQILIVDSDNVLQGLLARFLALHGFNVHCATNAKQASELVSDKQFSLVLLDTFPPEINGLEWINWIKQRHPKLPIFILSALNSYHDRINGFEQGAGDYLAKPFHPKELLIRIHNLLRTQTIINSPHLRIGDNLFDPEQELLHLAGNNTIKLTNAETRLLLFFYQHRGNTLTRDDISQHLYGVDSNPFARRIDMQVARLRKKLEPNTKAEDATYLHTVWQRGYRFSL